MLKVLMVDDEVVVRSAVRNNIDWEAHDFVFCGEAADGEMALSLIQEVKPDILITDIRMPFLDGLELSKIVRGTMPWIKIIILSGHDEFEYAKSAISVGVEEYLLKPIDSADMLEILKKTATRIQKEKEERMKVSLLKNKLIISETEKKSKIIYDLIYAKKGMKEILARANDLDIDLIAKYYVVLAAEFTVPENEFIQYTVIESIVEDFVNSCGDVRYSFLGNDRVVFVLLGNSFAELDDRVFEFAQALKYEVERHTCALTTIGVGKIVTRLSEVAKSFASADKARKIMMEQGMHHINTADEIALSEMETLIAKGSLADQLKYATMSDVQSIFEKSVKIDGPEAHSLLFCYYVVVDLYLGCARLINSFGGNPENVLPGMKGIQNINKVIQSQEDFKSYAMDMLIRTVEFKESQQRDKSFPIIKKAKEYIEQYYGDANISLHIVAKQVHLSPNHFSMVFSQKTGTTFIEYLTKVRMQQAKEQIEKSLKSLNQIAEEVGYSDANYFSYTFKKYEGITPSEYRKKCASQ